MKRPDAARNALTAYVNAVAGEGSEPVATQATDLIADLLHYVETHGEGGTDAAKNAVETGRFHWEYEQNEDDPS